VRDGFPKIQLFSVSSMISVVKGIADITTGLNPALPVSSALKKVAFLATMP